jgi:hypothetical protein
MRTALFSAPAEAPKTPGVLGLAPTKKGGRMIPPPVVNGKNSNNQRAVALASFSRWDMQLRQRGASGMISSRRGSMDNPQTSQYP